MSLPSSSTPQRLALLDQKPAGGLLIHEIYRSVQGESTFAGLPCVFVRLAVCDLRCTWCDTPHAFTQASRDARGDPGAGASWPVRWWRLPAVAALQEEVFPLMSRLGDAGHAVLLETSGSQDVSRVDLRVHIIMDLKCPDSGESANNRWANLEVLKPTDQVKFVLASRRDFDWAADTIRRHGLEQRFIVLLSPAFGLVTPGDLAAWLLASGLQVRMQLQLHKYVWDPKARGV